MNGGMVDVIRRIVKEELSGLRFNALGVVTATFPHESADDENNYEASVKLKHDDLELRRVPMAIGAPGEVAPPRPGDLVNVAFIGGDLQQPVITGRFYHDEDRPPLHRDGELLWEQRVGDDTLNHFRFTDDGSIFLQRNVSNVEDNSEAQTTIKIDGASGDLLIQAGDNIRITITHDDNIEILADGKPVTITCSKLTIDGEAEITGNTAVKGDLTVGQGATTTISGNQITGA
jgi:uncharacterized protein involved in type VI secretion and phage assembly